jgi:hypothetical protein
MADAKLSPRQLVDVLQRLDEIEKHGKGIRHHLIVAMAERRRTSTSPRKPRPRIKR